VDDVGEGLLDLLHQLVNLGPADVRGQRGVVDDRGQLVHEEGEPLAGDLDPLALRDLGGVVHVELDLVFRHGRLGFRLE